MVDDSRVSDSVSGEVLTTSVTVREKRPGNEVVLDCSVVNQSGETKIQGEAVAVIP